MMLRSGASRLASRSMAATTPRQAGRFFDRTASPLQWSTTFSSMVSKRPQSLPMAHLKPLQAALLRRTMADKINHKAEDKYAHEKLEVAPERVTSDSTMHPVFGNEIGQKEPEPDTDMTASMRSDLNTIKDTFSLSEVPREAYYIGLAGVLPYLATSLSTVFCSYEISHSVAGQGYLLSAHSAETLLQLLEPLQIGYGAVILSFLGAIHWGLEFAGFGGSHGYRRYAIGVVAPAIAWPTVLMSVESALIAQFSAFVLLYYVDTRASYRGWVPHWYAIYRFVLTFIVGASIVVSLVGRGEVAHRVARTPGAVDKITALRENAQETLVEEEQSAVIDDDSEGDAKKDDDSEGDAKKDDDSEGDAKKDDDSEGDAKSD